MTVRNPVLPGFHPDPSLLRVGTDYYLATSTFEWFPGVALHRSADLVHWQRLPSPLSRTSQLDMTGIPDSGGIWAPCLSHDGTRFYLIYTNVACLDGGFKDTPNVLVTADAIEGPWSEPVFLNASGFDPSLFHDDDGRKWLVNMVWDHRPGKNPFHGILLQEYDPAAKKLVGKPEYIFRGTPLGCTEGPHLYKHNGWYYLVVAEGGTGYEHAVSVARSRNLKGPYEVHPDNPILTSRGDRSLPLQKTGHASLIRTPEGDTVMAFLCSRPLGNGRCVLGRETALESITWGDDGWPRLQRGGNRAGLEGSLPALPARETAPEPERYTFAPGTLPPAFCSLRVPVTPDWADLSSRPGFLRLYGRESLCSMHRQSLLARRVDAFAFTAETVLEFAPETFQQMAGLVCYYNTKLWHYLHITHDEGQGRILSVLSSDHLRFTAPEPGLPLPDSAQSIQLRAEVTRSELRFSFSTDGGTTFAPAGGTLDFSILSDDYATRYPDPGWGFTGAFVGMACQDLTGQKLPADFVWFRYSPSGSSS